MRKITLTTRPTEPFPAPTSTGYSVYGALLGKLESIDAEISQYIHDTEFASLHNSGLMADDNAFAASEKRKHKRVLPSETYTIKLGIIDNDDIEIFDALAKTFGFDSDPIELTHGNLNVETFTSEHTSYGEVLDTAQALNAPNLSFTFETVTGIKESGGVTTAYPHRRSVFRSLLCRWNKTCPDGMEIDITTDDIEQSLIEHPYYGTENGDSHHFFNSVEGKATLSTDSVVTKRVVQENSRDYLQQLQGFRGTCGYQFKKPDNNVATQLTALALFADYSGIGSAVSRGCGATTVEVMA